MGVVVAGFLYAQVLRQALPPPKPHVSSALTTAGQGPDVLPISWSGWLWATVAALAGGQLIGLLLFIGQTGLGSVHRLSLFSIKSPLIEGAIVGLALGCLQWIILMPLGQRAKWWIPLTAVAVVLGEYAWTGVVTPQIFRALHNGAISPTFFSLARNRLTTAVLVGALVGGAQWIVMRPWLKRAGLWVLVNVVAWPLGLLLGKAAAHLPIEILFVIMQFFVSFVERVRSVVMLTVQSAALGLGVGALTGWALLRLSKREEINL
jgi:hypothetical protein